VNVLRNVLLAGSQNAWLSERAMRYPFVRRSVSRFMPGERIEDAIDAARRLQPAKITTILTQLGENLTRPDEADAVTHHYMDVLERVRAAGLDAQISIKPTQLGLDLDAEQCYRNLQRLVDRAAELHNVVWIDMESSPYVDPTLALYRRVRERSDNIGVALQAYLYRTSADLDALLPLNPAIRLVKGAYREPGKIAFPRKADVDEHFFALASRMLAVRTGLLGIATHDAGLIGRLQDFIREHNVLADAYEFEMLYGIQRGLQTRLAGEGRRVRVLISYGEHWFPWYMRRLAERPANVWFVVKSLVSG
jgi:proline dehydrogenase